MKHEGMVHALEEIHRLLKSGGVLLDIHPVPEGYIVKVFEGEKILYSERKRETLSEDVRRAEEALAEVVERDLFVVDQSAEFDFLTYGSSARELRDYWDDLNAFEAELKDAVMIAREEELYTQVEEIMLAAKAGSEVAIHERARITRLRSI